MLGYQIPVKACVIYLLTWWLVVKESCTVPTVNKRPVSIQSRVTPNWLGANTQGKTCLSFCPYVNCNHGTCYQDPRNCDLSCICEVGYWGRRCQFEIRTTTVSPTIPDPKSKSDSDIVRMSLGSVRNNVEGKDNDSSLNASQTREGSETNFLTELEPVTKNVSAIFGQSVDLFIPDPKKNGVKKQDAETDQDNRSPRLVPSMERDDRITIKMNRSRSKTENTTTPVTTRTRVDLQRKDDDVSPTTTTKSLAMVTTVSSSQEDEQSDIHLIESSESELALSVLEPFQSEYLDVCEKNCSSDHVCVPVQNRFHCYPKKFQCLSGFPCENGICVKNGSQIKCVCEPGWIGDMCDRKCFLNCNGGTCYHRSGNSDDDLVCLCKFGYEGKRCEHRIEIIPEEEDIWYWYVLIPVICCFVILVVILATFIYCMQKRKWLFAMKIVHFFKEYEDDDGKEYDAFISYKSSKEDEDFVLHQLYPKLEEEMGFKLCMHFRDFTPGDIIANNIIHAIENSRRTIMILSPNYVESEWCRMEYQKAQHEMLKRKHRIIPIMFRDITKVDKCDKALYDILSTVTYIQWPEDGDSLKISRFWDQLRLSLPKKRVPSSSSSSSSSSSGSESTETSDIYSSSSSILPPISSSTLSSEKDSLPPSKTEMIYNITGNESSILNSSYLSYVTTDDTKSDVHSVKSVDSSLSDVEAQSPTGKPSQTENSSSRLRKIVKDMLKLKIHSRSNSFVRLQREGSVDTPTPTTSSPSVLIDKEVNPLILKRKSKKSSTWTAKSLQHSLRPCARSMSEKDCSVNRLDILPQSSVRRRELPDVCKHLDQGHVNVGFENDDKSDRGTNSSAKIQEQFTSDSSDNANVSNELQRNIEEPSNNSKVTLQRNCDSDVSSADVKSESSSDPTNGCITCIQNAEPSNVPGVEQSKQVHRSFRNDIVRKSKKSNIPRRHSDGVKINMQSSKTFDNQVNITESSIFNCDYPSYVHKDEEGNTLYHFNGDENCSRNSRTYDSSNVFGDWINKPHQAQCSENSENAFSSFTNATLDEINCSSSCSPTSSYFENSERDLSSETSHHMTIHTNVSNDAEHVSENSCDHSYHQYNVLPEEPCHRNCETCIIANDSDTNCNNNPCYSIYIPPNYIQPLHKETSKIQNTATTDCLIPRGPSGLGVDASDVHRRSSVPNSPKTEKPLKQNSDLPRRVSAPHLLNAVLEVKGKEHCTEGEQNPTPVPPVRRKRKQRISSNTNNV